MPAKRQTRAIDSWPAPARRRETSNIEPLPLAEAAAVLSNVHVVDPGVDQASGAMGSKHAGIRLKRVYQPASDDDGQRVLVDRLWPRGLSRAKARVDLWLREVAPSPALRTWFDHRLDRWVEFRRRYLAELGTNDAVPELRARFKNGPITLLYAAHDVSHNHALVLAEFLGSAPAPTGSGRADAER